jgi:hypothetical protein
VDAIEILDTAGRHVCITILAIPNRQRIERKGRCVCRLKLYGGLFSKIATQCVKAGVSARDARERARQSTTEHVLPAVGLSSFRGPIDNGRVDRHYKATTPIKKGFDSDFAMVFTLRNGKVTHFQEFCDSAAINAAYAVGAAV